MLTGAWSWSLTSI